MGSNFLKKAMPYLAGAVGGGVANQFSALKPFSAAISAGAGSLANKNNRIGGALQGFAGGGVGSAIGGGLGSKAGFGAGAMEGLKTYGSSIPGFKGIGTSAPVGAMAKFLTPQSIQNPSIPHTSVATPTGSTRIGMGQGFNRSQTGVNDLIQTPQFAATGAAGTPASVMTKSIVPPANSGSGTGDIFKNFNVGQLGAGAGISMMGDMFAKDVPASDFSSVTNPLRERINNPSPNAQAAMDTYLKTMNQPMGGSAESGIANARLISDRQRAENARNLTQQFQAAGGGNIADNTAYQTAMQKMNAEMDQNYAAQAAQTQFQYDTMQRQQQMAAAQAIQGMDEAQIQSLANLAQYDIYTIAEQTGYDLQKAQAIKDLASQVGGYVMQNAMGVGGNQGGQNITLKVA